MTDDLAELELSECRYIKALWTRRLYATKPHSVGRSDFAELFGVLDRLPADEREAWFADYGAQLDLVLRPEPDPEPQETSES